MVVCFCTGNDLVDAYRLVKNIPQWRDLFGLHELSYPEYEASRKNFQIVLRHYVPRTFQRKLLYVLSAHSALVRFVRSKIESLIKGKFTHINRHYYKTLNQKFGEFVFVPYEDDNVCTVFTPAYRLSTFNLNEPAIREGLRITLTAIEAMARLARSNGIKFLLVIIPTKEGIYTPYVIQHDSYGKEILIRTSNMEERVRKAVVEKCLANGINCEDLTPYPRAQAAKGLQLYPPNTDGHPNALGHRIIGEKIAEIVKRLVNR